MHHNGEQASFSFPFLPFSLPPLPHLQTQARLKGRIELPPRKALLYTYTPLSILHPLTTTLSRQQRNLISAFPLLPFNPQLESFSFLSTSTQQHTLYHRQIPLFPPSLFTLQLLSLQLYTPSPRSSSVSPSFLTPFFPSNHVITTFFPFFFFFFFFCMHALFQTNASSSFIPALPTRLTRY